MTTLPACPHCEEPLDVEDFDVGDWVECPACGGQGYLAAPDRLTAREPERSRPSRSRRENPYRAPRSRTPEKSDGLPPTPVAVWFIAGTDFLLALFLLTALAGMSWFLGADGMSTAFGTGMSAAILIRAAVNIALGIGMLRGWQPAWMLHLIGSGLGTIAGLLAFMMGGPWYELAGALFGLVLLLLPSTRHYFRERDRAYRRGRRRRSRR